MNMEDIKEILTKQDVILEQLTKISTDHEQRIRKMEHYISYGLGIIGIGSLILNVFGPAIHK